VDFDSTLKILLGRGEQGPLGPAEWKRVKVRVAWVSGAIAALEVAERQMHERCRAAVNRVSEEEFNRIFDEEQAKVSAILDQLHAARDHDRWPAELYFGGV
jgi:hypothetical protein